MVVIAGFALLFATLRSAAVGGSAGVALLFLLLFIGALAVPFWAMVFGDILRSFPHPDPSLRRW